MPGDAAAPRGWWAPALAHEGDDAALIELLRTGQSKLGSALGPMAEVVRQSTQHWHDEDLRAVALYLRSLPRSAARAAAGTPTPTPDLANGQRLYADRCARCHGERGEGAAGLYPPLAGNASVRQDDIVNLVHVLRWGGFAPATEARPRPFGMPPPELSDAQSADVLSYIRGAWGNDAAPVSALDVMRAR